MAGQREHRTLHAKPWEVFERNERPAMRPLPETPFEIVRWFPVAHSDENGHRIRLKADT